MMDSVRRQNLSITHSECSVQLVLWRQRSSCGTPFAGSQFMRGSVSVVLKQGIV